MSAVIDVLKENENFETYCLIWLDDSTKTSQEIIQAQEKLRTIINCLIIFNDSHQCCQYIHSLTKDDRVVMIVNEKLGRNIIPKINDLQQIVSIYIYGKDKDDSRWFETFIKVSFVIDKKKTN